MGELFEVAGEFLIASETLATGLTACALSVKAYGFARFPFLSLRNIFPRSGGSLSSKGELARKRLRGLTVPLGKMTANEVSRRKG